MPKPNVVSKPAPPPPAPKPVEQLVTLMGIAKDGSKYRAVEVLLPLSVTKPLELGNRKTGLASWELAQRQCELELRRRYSLGMRPRQ